MISLHSFIKHLVFDIKNIKDFLSRIYKYILDKSINNNKANDVKNLKAISKVAWEFPFVIYETHWNSRRCSEIKLNNSIHRSTKYWLVAKIRMQLNPFISSHSLPLFWQSHLKKANEISKYFKKIKNNYRRNCMLKFLPNLICQTLQ